MSVKGGRSVLLLLTACLLVSCRGANPAGDAGIALRAATLAIPGSPAQTVAIPALLPIPFEPLTYELRFDVALPNAMRHVPLGFSLPGFEGRAVVWADGQQLRASPLENASAYRASGARHYVLPASTTQDGQVQVRLEVAHRSALSARMTAAPAIFPLATPDPRVAFNRFFNETVATLALMALLQVGVTCVVVFLLDRRRRAYLFFGIQALTASYYPLFVLGVTPAWLGGWDMCVLALALLWAIYVSIWFTHSFFHLSRPPRAILAVTWVGTVAVLVAPGPYDILRFGGIAVVAPIVAVATYQLLTCARLFAEGRDKWSAGFLLTAWLALAATTWGDFMFWGFGNDVFSGARVAMVGLCLFAVSLSLLLSRSHIVSMNRADALNEELSSRVGQLLERRQEIEQLNTELRRQVTERSSQLFAALSLSASRRGRVPQLRAGAIVQGRYRVIGPLGTGGMGAVYEVVRLSDERRFALKLTRQVDKVGLARFAREAQIASEIEHENLVSVYDVDVAPEGFLFLIMGLVDGPSLARRRDRFGDVAWALPILLDVARGLRALHERGVVHRDLKPANVLLTESGECVTAQISDFGISHWGEAAMQLVAEARRQASAELPLPEKDDSGTWADLATDQSLAPGSDLQTAVARPSSPPDGNVARPYRRDVTDPELPSKEQSLTAAPSVSASGQRLTRTGLIAGTPLYMAPELISEHDFVLPASDLFSFGFLAYLMLTGEEPYAESLALARMNQRHLPPPRPLSHRLPTLPAKLAAALDACLVEVPEERPSAVEVVTALESAVSIVLTGRPAQPTAVPHTK